MAIAYKNHASKKPRNPYANLLCPHYAYVYGGEDPLYILHTLRMPLRNGHPRWRSHL